MANQQLLDFIKTQSNAGISAENIKISLLTMGWPEKYINEGFTELMGTIKSLPPTPPITTLTANYSNFSPKPILASTQNSAFYNPELSTTPIEHHRPKSMLRFSVIIFGLIIIWGCIIIYINFVI
ncbi:MAG: hypothetical protein Q8L47_01010 [bacterium]|nr:hypothetical protein [bacterium]